MATLLQDDFNRANSTSVLGSPAVGPAPVVQGGTWGISSNQAYASVVNAIVTYELATPNVELSLTAAVVSNVNGVGFILGYTSLTDFWGALCYSDRVELIHGVVGGVGVEVSRALPSNTSHEFKMNYRDKIIRVYVDGVLVIWHELADAITATKHGMRATNNVSVRLDNLLGVDSPAVTVDGFLGETRENVPIKSDAFFTPAFGYQGHDTKLQDQAAGS